MFGRYVWNCSEWITKVVIKSLPLVLNLRVIPDFIVNFEHVHILLEDFVYVDIFPFFWTKPNSNIWQQYGY